MSVPDKYYGEQNFELSRTLLEKQGEINQLKATIARVKALAAHLDGLAGPDLDWSVRAKDAAAKIRAALNGALNQSDQEGAGGE